MYYVTTAFYADFMKWRFAVESKIATLGLWLIGRVFKAPVRVSDLAEVWWFIENLIGTGFRIGEPDRIRIGFGQTLIDMISRY